MQKMNSWPFCSLNNILPLHSISSPSTLLPSLVLLEQSERAGARAGERETPRKRVRKTGDRLSKEKRERDRKSQGGSGWEEERDGGGEREEGEETGKEGAADKNLFYLEKRVFSCFCYQKGSPRLFKP
jgi:hypothetical protein